MPIIKTTNIRYATESTLDPTSMVTPPTTRFSPLDTFLHKPRPPNDAVRKHGEFEARAPQRGRGGFLTPHREDIWVCHKSPDKYANPTKVCTYVGVQPARSTGYVSCSLIPSYFTSAERSIDSVLPMVRVDSVARY